MYGALLLFESEFVHIVAISFTSLILTELLMVALTIQTWHWLMTVAELLSLACYIASLVFLHEFIGETPCTASQSNGSYVVKEGGPQHPWPGRVQRPLHPAAPTELPVSLGTGGSVNLPPGPEALGHDHGGECFLVNPRCATWLRRGFHLIQQGHCAFLQGAGCHAGRCGAGEMSSVQVLLANKR